MSRSPLPWLLASAAVSAAALAEPAAAEAGTFRFHVDHVLGTSLDLAVIAPDEATALMAFTAARREIDRLEPILSAWRPDSELSRLNRAGSVCASADLRAVLDQCEAWRAATNGAFDCRLGEPLARLRGGDSAAAAWPATRQPIAFGTDGVIARGEGQALTVDGLAKGYVIDRALEAARRSGPHVQGLLVDIGGDLRCWGRAPSAEGWRVGVAACGEADNLVPARQLRLADRALAVSGRGQRDLSVDGRRLAETLDPATRRPVTAVRSAAVTAPTATCADALATAFMVMAPRQALALADRTPGVDALIVADDGTEHRSSGWSQLEQPRLVRASFAASASAAAPAVAAKGLSLDIGYTVPRLDAEPYHAPYVVMWITDANRQLVRTLLVLGAKPKWAPENYVWWRRYGRLAPQVLDTVGRPTRLPGRYTVHWDGKDEAGRPAAAGKYILHIESAREKGGHTYQTIDLDFGARGAKSLPAKDEMGPVDLRFGPA
ncbi:DUF2271 domain-containing protein [Caulobacter sp. KR2-114]|uniref:DUF2271 domain-containing protein n=1 Tax=Caulobacter sp. KR2-114 TaxID=3400912 RepID=UPI003C0D0BDC